MRAPIVALISLLLLSKNALGLESGVFRPQQVAFADVSTTSEWIEALQTEGILSISRVPAFEKKIDALHAFSSCIKQSSMTKKHVFPDGAERTTLASHFNGAHSGSTKNSWDCPSLDESTIEFRDSVEDASVVVAKRIMEVLGMQQPLLTDENDKPYTLLDIVEYGDHLEHFHVYSKVHGTDDETVEWHVDQGLFLLFTPALVDGETTNDFLIQRRDGTTSAVKFESSDDLILLIGDGFNQYVNQALDRALLALPHAVRMSETATERLWYGRMVLPPPQCKHPTLGQTFATLRQGLVAGDTALGCSSNMKARELQDVTCDDSTAMYCWHRCMNFTDYNVSMEACAEDGLDVGCVNDEGLLWNNKHNPDFKLGCVDLETAKVFEEPEEATDTTSPPESSAFGFGFVLLPLALLTSFQLLM